MATRASSPPRRAPRGSSRRTPSLWASAQAPDGVHMAPRAARSRPAIAPARRRPAVTFRDMLGLGELPRVHAARADVAGLAGLHHVVQRLHRLLDRGLEVPAMDLVEVDVVQLQPL